MSVECAKQRSCDAAAIPMSEDHKPNRADERQRIESAGGIVVWAGTWRVGGVLAGAPPLLDMNPQVLCRNRVAGSTPPTWAMTTRHWPNCDLIQHCLANSICGD